MEKTKTWGNGDIIFRQGDASDGMYVVQSGKVGIYLDYGGPNETKLSELQPGQFFGEMGLLNDAPRSATAVSLENAEIELVTEEDFYMFYEKNPDLMMFMMEQMCLRLRRTTRDYIGVCNTICEVMEADETGVSKSATLQNRIAKYLSDYDSFHPDQHE